MKRIGYLDMARGIGMILVVLGHITFVDESLRRFITSFHMPLFLMISGILLYITKTEERSFSQIVKGKCKSILLPYFVFSMGAILLELVRAMVKNLDMGEVLFRDVFQTICLQGFSTFWFLPTLFLGELIFIRVRQTRSLRVTGVIGACIMVFMYLVSFVEQDFYQMHVGILGYELLHDVLLVPIRAGIAAGYIFLGYFLGILLEKKRVPLFEGLWGIGMLLAMAFVSSVTGFIDLRFLQIGNPIVFLLRTVCGSLGVLLLCRSLENVADSPLGRVLRFYGQNSLIIMVTHLDYRILNYSIKAASLVNEIIPNQVLYVVCTVLFVFVSEAFVIFIFNRFVYSFLGRKTQKQHTFFTG